MNPPTFDLQTGLAAMADYPALLRRLGVIRILEVDLAGSGINPALAGPVTVSAKPTWPTKLPAAAVKIAPVRAPAHLGPGRFALVADGRVDPVAAKLEVVEVDTDGAALGLVNLARNVRNADVANAKPKVAGQPPVTLPKSLSLPALRNAGLSLVQGDRAVNLRERLVEGKGLLTAAGAMALTDPRQAVVGHLVDVWDDRTGRWHTLCARRGTYRLPGGTTLTLDDEGSVSLAATAREAAVASSALYLHQSLVRWTGWSLVAPRPGKIVQTETPGTEPKPGVPALPGFSVSFAAMPGTLPRLRFGVGYRFALRLVDVAGHADRLDPSSGDFSRATPLTRYLRFDPVVAPILVPTAPMSEGESVQTMVIRPDPGLIGAISSLLAPILSTPPVRHVAPPKVGELLCEEHGGFDDASGVPDPGRYAEIARRDAATLTGVGTPDPRQPNQRYLPGPTLPVAWLPDPIARGATIAGLPGGPFKVRFDPPLLGAWPNVQAFRLQLDDGAGAPFWNPLFRLLTVFVPRGETRSVRLSSFVDPDDLALLGLVDWMGTSGASADVAAAARADVVAGTSWQVTPWKDVTLVNAVRVPLASPTLDSIVVDAGSPRAVGSTTQALVVRASVHRPSTGRLTLNATWTDPVDDTENPAGAVGVTASSSPAEVTVDYDPPAAGPQVDFKASQSFGDTRRRQVAYSLVGATRYMEYFVHRGTATLRGTTPVALSSGGVVPGSDTVRSADGAVTYRRGSDYAIDERAGTLARVAGGPIPDGATVEVAIVAPPVSRPSQGPPVTVPIPSTTRPLPPKVAWIVPTFGWTASQDLLGLNRRRARSGGGLRVFLDRPWYSSGVGEQLAVVLAGGPVEDSDEHLLDLVTRLGADPAVGSPTPKAFPAPADFLSAIARPTGLSLAELATRATLPKVAAATFDVVWDAARQRWAADVVLPPDRAYQPFARLVLARYQPGSVAGVELSPVALVEWVQLVPDRAATIALDPIDLTKVTVTVAGRSADGTREAMGRPNAVSVIVQTSTVPSPADLDWQTVGSADGQLLAAATQLDGTTLWTGTLRLPAARLLRPYRLVVTETEQFKGGGRLVYSDVIRL